MTVRLVVVIIIALAACRHHSHDEDRDDEFEEEEERDADRLQYWRVQIAIVGDGEVRTAGSEFACVSDEHGRRGDCGPKLVTFKELRPPLLHATGAPGWKLEHWESQTTRRDGTTSSRPGRMPDGRFYLNGFGYADSGALETVTAVFVTSAGGNDDRAEDQRATAR